MDSVSSKNDEQAYCFFQVQSNPSTEERRSGGEGVKESEGGSSGSVDLHEPEVSSDELREIESSKLALERGAKGGKKIRRGTNDHEGR